MPKLNHKPDHLRMLQDVLKTHASEAEVWAYASRVNGDGHDGSDLDLVLRNPVHLTQPQPQLGALRAALSESNLPMWWTFRIGRGFLRTFGAKLNGNM